MVCFTGGIPVIVVKGKGGNVRTIQLGGVKVLQSV